MGYVVNVKKHFNHNDDNGGHEVEASHETRFETFEDALNYYNNWFFKTENDGEPHMVIYTSEMWRTNEAGVIDAAMEKDWQTGAWEARETFWRISSYARSYNGFGFVQNQWVKWTSHWLWSLGEIYDYMDSQDLDIEEGAIEQIRVVDGAILYREPIGEADER